MDTIEFPTKQKSKVYAAITPYYSQSLCGEKYLEEVKSAFGRFAIADLTLKVAGDDLTKPLSKLFYEFKDDWTCSIESPFQDQVRLSLFIDPPIENQELNFNIFLQVTSQVNARRELELISKYGEEQVVDFLDRLKLFGGAPSWENGHFKGINSSEEYKNWVTANPLNNNDQDNHFCINIGTEIDFLCCKINANQPSRYESEWPPTLPESMEIYREKFKEFLTSTAQNIGYELKYQNGYSYSKLATEANNLIPKAIDQARKPEDYRVINALLTLKNLYSDYTTIIEFGERLATGTIKHHSVVSFYLNNDLWRIVPIVLDKENWVSLVDNYLGTFQEKQTQEKATSTTHSEHTSLVISASRQGPMLYGFCRNNNCRHRILKSLEIIVSGISLKKEFERIGGECTHPKVALKRSKHFNILATCQVCHQTVTVRNVFLESKDVLSPRFDCAKIDDLGDSILPKGDPRLLPDGK